MIKQFQCIAKIIDSDKEVEGGICDFYNNDKQKKVFLVIHKDHEGKPMISQVDPKTIKGVFDCWGWLFSWIDLYEKSNKSIDFKSWLNMQPMTTIE